MLIMPGDSLTDSNTFTYLMHGDMEGVHVKEVIWVHVQYANSF